MKMRRITATLLVLAMLLVCLPVQAFADVAASGTCGENLTWKFTDDGTLTISGTGAMPDYPYSAAPEYLAPWRSFQSYITRVVVESGVTYIGDCAFVHLTNLTSVTIPNSVTAMGKSVFADCEALKTVRIPDSVVSMGASVFTDCSALENVTLSQGLTAIDYNVFERCRALEQVLIPASVNSIAYGVFRDCTGLKEVRFLGSVPTIDSQAFGYVSASVFYRANDPSWTDEVKQNYGGTLLWFGVDNPAVDTMDTLSGFCGMATTWKLDNGCLTISGTGRVEEVAWKVVKHEIRKVVIEEGVTNIVSEAFSYCTELTDISISSTVADVGSGAFSGCTGLKKVILPENVTSIGYRAFAECSALTQIVIPDTVSEIGTMAFVYCTSLKKITLPAKLCSVQDSLFFRATALESIVIPNGVQYIAEQAFSGCESLKSVDIPASVSYIEDYAFAFCSSLRTITFCGNAPEFRGNYPFKDVTATAYYPAGNETWTTGAMVTFNANLKWVAKRGIQQPAPAVWTLEDGVLTIYRDVDIIFWEDRRDEISQVVIQDGVTVIGERWFAGCTNLTSVTIPESVRQIKYGAFWGMTSLKEVVIPSGVYALGNYAFSSCTSLKKVTFLGQKPSFENDGAFENVTAEVYYPSEDVTWTEDVRQNYGGELTWIPYCRTHTDTTTHAEADCINYGTITYTCSVCGDVRVEPDGIPPQGHYYGLDEDGNPDFWDTTCDVCGAERVVDKHRPTHSMYRMYNPNSGEHFYTGSMEERQNLVAEGWKYEGVGFTFPASTGKPVYRLYDKFDTFEHLYTMDEAEKDKLLAEGWVLEGVAFNSGREDEVPQYRLHNPNETIGAYHFTASIEERDTLIAAGWEDQGIGFYTCWQ